MVVFVVVVVVVVVILDSKLSSGDVISKTRESDTELLSVESDTFVIDNPKLDD